MTAAWRNIGLWLLAMVCGALVVWNSRFVADMSFFLPSKPSAEQKVLIGQMKEGVVSRLLMLSIGGGNASQRAQASQALREQLAQRPEFLSVQNGANGSIEAEKEFLFKHRYLLSPAVSPERFSEAGLRAAVAGTIDTLSSPLGMLFKPYLTRDPTGEFLELLQGFNPGAQPNTVQGVWASRDGERAMLLVQARALGSDTDAQEQAIALVRQSFAEVVRQPGLNGLALELSGPALFAVRARETIREEVSRLAFISSLASMAILFWVYRSVRLVALGMLPVMSAALAGVVSVSLVHGTVFGITMGFGSALIGEAVDYAIYYFVQSSKVGLEQWRRECWPTIRLGVFTTIVGFGTLLFSGFPGLAQLGLYALSGVMAAALVTRYVLPYLVGTRIRVPDHGRVAGWLNACFERMPRWRWAWLAMAVLAAAYLVVQRHDLWSENLSVLSTVSDAEVKLDSRLRADLAAPDARYMVVVTAKDRETALRSAELAGAKLDPLVAEGTIGGYDSPARFLPSAGQQAARLASLPDASELSERLKRALADSPLSAAAVQDFVREVDSARRAAPLTRASLDGTGLALLVDSLLMPTGQGWTVLLPLRPDANGEMPVKAVAKALEGSPALLVDMKGEFDRLYGNYLDEALLLSLAGLFAIVCLLAASLRSGRRLWRVMLPLVLTVVIVIAALHALGEALNLLHLVGVLLIFAVGSNYTLVFDRVAAGEALELDTLMSMAVANLTTVVGFGTLALSSVPVLHAIGVTVGLGALLALFLSAAFIHRAAPRSLA